MNNNCCEAHMPRVFAKNICGSERLFYLPTKEAEIGGQDHIH